MWLSVKRIYSHPQIFSLCLSQYLSPCPSVSLSLLNAFNLLSCIHESTPSLKHIIVSFVSIYFSINLPVSLYRATFKLCLILSLFQRKNSLSLSLFPSRSLYLSHSIPLFALQIDSIFPSSQLAFSSHTFLSLICLIARHKHTLSLSIPHCELFTRNFHWTWCLVDDIIETCQSVNVV